VNGPFALNSSSTQKLWLNLCRKQSSSVLCIDPISGDSISSYSCLVDASGGGVDAGRLLSVHVNDDRSVRMSYTNGQTAKGCTGPSTTDILLICDPDTDTSSPVEVSGSSICALQLEWRISYACYLCDQSDKTTDYEHRESDCVNNNHTLADFRIHDCYGPKVINSSSEYCKVPFHVPIYLIVIVLAVIVLLIVIVIAIAVWNLRLQKQYSALVQKSSGSYEMDEVPESAIPDDEEDQ